MTKIKKTLVVSAMISGLIGAASLSKLVMANDEAAKEGEKPAAEKHDCKAKAHCKGKDHCKGKGKCKGKGGCKHKGKCKGMKDEAPAKTEEAPKEKAE